VHDAVTISDTAPNRNERRAHGTVQPRRRGPTRVPATPTSALRSTWIPLLLCAGLSGCGLWPVIGANLAAQGAQGVAALTLGPLADMQERSEKDRCLVHARHGISVTETLETAVSRRDSHVTEFELAFWRVEFARDGYPEIEARKPPVEGTLAVGDGFVAFVAPPGTISVRIPFELVQDVAIQHDAGTGAPRALIVRSCNGRFDIVTFRQSHGADLRPDAISAAAAQIENRVAVFRANAGN
jgi:hypothetical protein